MRVLSFLVAAAFPLLLSSVASAQTPAAPAPRAAKKDREKKPEGPVANLLGFEAIPGGGSRLYVELTKGTTVTQHETAGQIVFVLEGVQIRTGNTENSLELYYHNTPVLRAKLRRAKPDRKAKKKERDAELTIELKSNARPTHRLVDGQKGVVRLEIDFPEESREAPPKKSLETSSGKAGDCRLETGGSRQQIPLPARLPPPASP